MFYIARTTIKALINFKIYFREVFKNVLELVIIVDLFVKWSIIKGVTDDDNNDNHAERETAKQKAVELILKHKLRL